METYMEKIKTTLYDLIHEMSEHYWLYVTDPERNFSRDRKLPFEKVLAMLISMGGGSLRNELIDHLHCSADMASAPAFVQRKAQLLPEALEDLFHQFTEATAKEHLYKGYRYLRLTVPICKSLLIPRMSILTIPEQTVKSITVCCTSMLSMI